MNLSHILIAYDLSPLADRALERGFKLAEEMGANVTVLRVVEPKKVNVDAELARAHPKLEDEVEQLAETVRELAGRTGVIADFALNAGTPVETILEQAKELKADLIVLGLHKPEGIVEWFAGSTAEAIIRKSDIPVLTVRHKSVNAYTNILSATDFSPCSKKALDTATAIAPDATIHLAHIYEDPLPTLAGISDRSTSPGRNEAELFARESAARELTDFISTLGDAGKRITPILDQGRAKPRLDKLVEEHKPDLIALGTTGRSGVVTTLIGGVASDFLRHPPCDILVAKAK